MSTRVYVTRRAAGFDMRVLAYDPTLKPGAPGVDPDLVSVVDLETLLAESDFISLHVPLTEETHHLIGPPEIGLMKPSAILINTSRGPVVDTGALLGALDTWQIRGAALDVTDPEPLPADHPLLALPNCMVVPHIASASVATRNKMAVIAAENLLAGLEGRRLPHCVNPEVYEG